MDERNSVLDEQGDVVLFQDCDGIRHVFRDRVHDGLILHGDSNSRWTLTDDTGKPVCEGGAVHGSRDRYTAVDAVTGETVARHDTQYGLIAKAARRYLRLR